MSHTHKTYTFPNIHISSIPRKHHYPRMVDLLNFCHLNWKRWWWKKNRNQEHLHIHWLRRIKSGWGIFHQNVKSIGFPGKHHMVCSSEWHYPYHRLTSLLWYQVDQNKSNWLLRVVNLYPATLFPRLVVSKNCRFLLGVRKVATSRWKFPQSDSIPGFLDYLKFLGSQCCSPNSIHTDPI